MSTNPFEPPKDTALESAWGTIVEPQPDEFAFVCKVRLDDGREVQAMIMRRDFTPERSPTTGDRVHLTVDEGLCLVSQWFPAL